MIAASRDFQNLRLDHVARAFGALNALWDVTLEVKRGEFIALLGPSGCGKSTALNCIAGLLPLTGGSIWLDAQRIDRLKPESRGFGMVFQNYALFPHMTVRKNVGFGLRMQGKGGAEIDRKVEEALALVHLSDQVDKLPGTLSGGQQQRVAIARAIVIEPPLVLMDEPLSNLDAKLRLEMRAEIRRIHNLVGSTTIYVTHDQDEALSLADRVVVMRAGSIRQVGAPTELYETPAHLDVAEFMGFRNRLTGTLVGREGERGVVEVNGARVSGLVREPVASGAAVVMAVRPDDMVAGAVLPSSIAATVETIEYRGREFVGTARAAGDLELVFRSAEALQPGVPINLNADEKRVLIYPQEA
jgi:putative spermidine/putrescine transport system ATP-binding protein